MNGFIFHNHFNSVFISKTCHVCCYVGLIYYPQLNLATFSSDMFFVKLLGPYVILNWHTKPNFNVGFTSFIFHRPSPPAKNNYVICYLRTAQNELSNQMCRRARKCFPFVCGRFKFSP